MDLAKEKMRRLLRRYPKVFRNRALDGRKMVEVYNRIPEPSDFMAFYSNDDLVPYVVASLVMKGGRYFDIDYITSHYVIDVYLGHIEEVPGLSSFNSEVIFVYDGPGMPNKQRGNMLSQLIEQQRLNGRKFWLFYRGLRSRMFNVMPELGVVMADNGFVEVDFNSNGSAASSSKAAEYDYIDEEI